MNDEPKSKVHSAEIVALRPEDLPAIPPIERVVVSHKKIVRIDWRNCDIQDINALGAEFEDCDFRYSHFDRGYFRDAKFTNCRFVGVRFSNCNFKSAHFHKCDFKFAHFQRCLLDVREVIASLPAEPNIRRDALQNLRANGVEIGDYASQGLLTLQEVEASKRHYSYALRGYDSYYRNKYPTIVSRAWAGANLTWLKVGGMIWGHGERPWRLLVSCLVILSILTLINFWKVMPAIGWNETDGGARAFEYVVRLFLDMSTNPKFRGFAVVDYLVVAMRYLYIGLFISVLFRSISHR